MRERRSEKKDEIEEKERKKEKKSINVKRKCRSSEHLIDCGGGGGSHNGHGDLKRSGGTNQQTLADRFLFLCGWRSGGGIR